MVVLPFQAGDQPEDRDCCAYLIEVGGELAFIDASLGPSVPFILENIRALGFEPRQVRYHHRHPRSTSTTSAGWRP